MKQIIPLLLIFLPLKANSFECHKTSLSLSLSDYIAPLETSIPMGQILTFKKDVSLTEQSVSGLPATSMCVILRASTCTSLDVC